MLAAGELFNERSCDQVGIQEIIDRAGVARATFYQHFDSKEMLCAAWLAAEAFLFELAQRDLLEADRPVRAKLVQKFDELRGVVEARSFRGCVCCHTASMAATDEAIVREVRRYRVMVREFWHDLAVQGGVAGTAAADLGDAWNLLHVGAIIESRNVGEHWPVEKALRSALAMADAAGVA